MKLLLLCSGGLSTSMLLNRLKAEAERQQLPLQVEAHGLPEYPALAARFDVILLGPQVAHKAQQVAAASGKPTAAIPALDYAVGNAANVLRQAQTLLGGNAR